MSWFGRARSAETNFLLVSDEIFPELVQILKDPNAPVALAMRERFPTPQALATASFTSLQEIRGKARSLSDAKLVELQRLAAQSIGIKDREAPSWTRVGTRPMSERTS